MSRGAHTYRLYGLSVRSSLALPGPRTRHPVDVTLVRCEIPTSSPAAANGHWFAHRRLADGSTHLHWRGLADFLISPDGSRIGWQRSARASHEAFRSYLLSQVLSFSLLARGREPLHASAVAVDGGVVAFLGGCGLGKSSLTAAFLRAGYPLVTDDLLVLARRGRGYLVEAGVPRIKLFPHVARRLLGVREAGSRMNPGTAKLVLPVPPSMGTRERLPLRTLYVLSRGRSVRIRPLTPATAFLEVVRDAFNTVRMDRERLAGQFDFARRLATTARVRRLSYPRRLAVLDAVREAILADLAAAV